MAESNNNSAHLSFTIGPVQAFVAQARRTRDLWAGSWLLSFLAETALAAAEQAGGTAIIPYRGSDQHEKVTSVDSPIGGYPNRFELSFDSTDNAKRAAKDATEAFQEAWKKVAAAVWNKYVEPAADSGNGTKEIWDRQIETFWEIAWVVGAPSDDAKTIAHLAAARKNIRKVRANPEPGIKCSLMGTLQEISGHSGKGASSKQEVFWGKLRKNLETLDVKEGERLCAIALVKRLFPHVIEQAVTNGVGDDLTQQESWPSTAFFAALPWLKKVEQSAPSEAEAYAKAARDAGWKNSERQAARESGLQTDWGQLDAPTWFAGAVRQNEPEADKQKVASLLGQLQSLYAKAGSKPVPYYALLLMDGDSMGKLVATLDLPRKVSEGLVEFSKTVQDVVKKRDGRTIYAGGDDVLALLPAEGALKAADELARKYQDSFAKVNRGQPVPEATLSGAIVYAHWKFPLRQVLHTAHSLLDDIAKDRTGRDSLAIGVIQGSGLQAIWSAPWSVVRGKEDSGFGDLAGFVDKFGSDSNNKEKTEFNASFLYLLREQFSKLFARPIERPGSFGTIELDDDLLTALANSEYRRRLGREKCKKVNSDTTQELVRPLLALSQKWKRTESANGSTSSEFDIKPDKKTFSFDGWRVARLLKQIKDGKVGDHE